MEVQKGLPGMIPPEPVQQTLPGMPVPVVPEKVRFAACGKQVMRNGVHYGDMVDENAAKCVAGALNAEAEQAEWAVIVGTLR